MELCEYRVGRVDRVRKEETGLNFSVLHGGFIKWGSSTEVIGNVERDVREWLIKYFWMKWVRLDIEDQ